MNPVLSHLGTRRLVGAALFATTVVAMSACGVASTYNQSPAGQPPAPAAAYAAPASTSTQPSATQMPAAASATPALRALLGAMSISVDGRRQTVLTDEQGRTLYYFTPDKGGRVTCTGGCAHAWPPLVLPSTTAAPQLPVGVSGHVGSVANPGGGTQITLNGWPLYRYAGDASPGEANGEGIGDNWFVATSGIPVTA